MDQDFPTSPAKRRRTMSPEETLQSAMANTSSAGNDSTSLSLPTSALAEAAAGHGQPLEQRSQPGSQGDNSFLDVLMQHVEAESTPFLQTDTQAVEKPPKTVALDPVAQAEKAQILAPSDIDTVMETSKDDPSMQNSALTKKSHSETRLETDTLPDIHEMKASSDIGPEQATLRTDEAPVEVKSVDATSSAVIGTSVIASEDTPLGAALQDPATADTTAQADVLTIPGSVVPDGNTEEPEWEIDSSPYESSTDSDSSGTTSSDDSDEDADGDYAMLDPEEQARILMHGDGGSDDEGGKSKEKGENVVLRTANERPEEVIPMPDIVVTDEMDVQELGKVEATVENTVLIKATVSGEYQVLESGSLLCLSDRKVIGVVSETLGRVEQPLYTVRFTNDKAIEEAGVSVSGTTVYYVLPHSTFVFTQPLKGIKGSDASNFHDEEVGDDEMEFSDDEAEAEHKRQMKLRRQGRRDDGGGRGRGGRGGGRHRGARQGSIISQPETNGALNYDDGADDGYTPLARPTNLHEMMGQSDPREGSSLNHPLPPPPPPISQGRGNHRGSRGRGRGNQRGRGGNQSHGNYQNAYSNGFQNQSYAQQHQPMAPPPPSFAFQNQQYQYQQQVPPNAPIINPQTGSYSAPFSPSPISPLPKQQFNPGNFQPPPFQYGGYQNPNQMQSMPLPPPPSGFMPNNNNSSNSAAPAPNFANGAWAGNLAAAAHVQRQLEELRKQYQQ